MPYKKSESKPGEKLLTLYTLLLVEYPNLISLGELAQKLNCSKQTILRLIDQLESSNYCK
ncbi:MAG: HTH domain-containing protein, partial [Desulfovibrionaceae bacterium]|nr:HTH domain-containing protein [Desulfovibrionaceae bacterium]